MKILSYGSLNIDHVYRVDHIAKPGETLAVKEYYQNAGGKGLNLSIAIGRGQGNVYHAGLVGQDGQLLLKTLEDNRVDMTYVSKIEGVSGHAIIQVSAEGENCILVESGANGCQNEAYISDVLSGFQLGDMIVLQNEINHLDLIISKAKQKGLTIILNPSPFNEKIESLDLGALDYLILNELEGEALTGKSSEDEIVKTLIAKYPKLKVVLTLGSKGVLYGEGDIRIRKEAYATRVIDTTAAGDTFAGYFISQISKETDIEKALDMASKAASISVSRHGACQSIPNLKEVLDYNKAQ